MLLLNVRGPLPPVEVRNSQPMTRIVVTSPFGPRGISSASSAAGRAIQASTAHRQRHRTWSKTRIATGSAPEMPSFASAGTTIPTPAPVVVESIAAPSVVRKATTLASAPLKVVTPLLHKQWTAALTECNLLLLFRDIPTGIQPLLPAISLNEVQRY